ncbi:MAG: methionyl-tRNA formyltransferase [Acidiferrobacterales bacterium]
MKIVFAGTPAFAVPTLRALVEARQHTVQAVHTQPDRPAGRGRHTRMSAVKELALELGLAVLQPAKFDPLATSQLKALAPEVLVVVAYGLILPAAVLQIPRFGGINVHASLLPRWRGAAPIARSLEAGEEITGITIMQMDEGMDTGDILVQQQLAVHKDDTAQSLHDRLAPLGAGLLLDTLGKLAKGQIVPRPQDGARACYAPKLRKQEAILDWSAPAQLLARKVRAFNPWPVAQTRFRDRQLRIWEVGPVEDACGEQDAAPGTVLSADRDGIGVRTGDGVLVIRRLQLEGGKPLSAQAFINGYRLTAGERLG